jgi:glycosyltransferase involved in cell wall biosynthesis
MKILIISREALFPTTGGHREYLLESIKGLAEYGNNIDVLSWGVEDDYEYNIGNIREYHYKSANDKLTQNINSKFIIKFSSTIGLGQIHTIRHKGLDIGHGKKFLKNDYDIVLHNGPDSNTLANYIGNELHIPKMERLDWVGLPYHSSYYKEWLHYIGEPYYPYVYLYKVFDRYVTKLEAKSIEDMDYIYTPTRKDMLKISSFVDESKLNYIYPFLYTENEIDNEDAPLYGEKYILFYSTPSLNSYEAIKYIYKIAKLNKRLKFIITGNFNNIRATYSGENLIFLGELPQNEFYSVLRNAYIVIFPLTLGHGIQMKLIRAFSFSKAVIANDGILKPIGDIMQDNRNIIIGETPTEFYERILYFNEDENLINEIGKESHKTYKQYFSPEIGIKKLNEYLNICKQN